MQRGMAAVMASLVLGLSSHAQEYDPMFDASVMAGTIGTTPVRLYLAPSPYISQGAGSFISAASNSIDVCMYELNLPMILGRLIDAHARGVKVRIAVPPSAKPGPYERTIYDQYRELEEKQVLRYTANKSGLMHNKFMVADGHSIWTGSYNLTVNDTQFNDNNAITLSNALIAANYTAEFEEIWEGRHGRRNSTPTPNPRVSLGETDVQTYFSPEDDVEGAMVREINKATNSIYVMAFGLSDDNIFNALSNCVAKGVNVYALFDLELARQKSSQSKPLRDAHATVRISANNGQMHHKVIVVDSSVVMTGSANFSAAAFEVNDENLLIFSSPPLARAFIREFSRCWLAKPYIYSKWSQAAAR